jgi:hypothetical protein
VREILVFGWAIKSSFCLFAFPVGFPLFRFFGFGAHTKTFPDVFSAFRTQSRTIFGTKRIFREVDQDDFPDPGNQVDQTAISVLFVLGIGRTTLLPVQKMSIFADRSARAKNVQAPHARNIQGIVDPGKNIDFCPVPADRSFNLKRLSVQGRVFKGSGRETNPKGVFRRTSLVRDSVNLEPEFQNS